MTRRRILAPIAAVLAVIAGPHALPIAAAAVTGTCILLAMHVAVVATATGWGIVPRARFR